MAHTDCSHALDCWTWSLQPHPIPKNKIKSWVKNVTEFMVVGFMTATIVEIF